MLFWLGSNGEKSLTVDIYPGFGWDHLRFIDLAPLYEVSNFNRSSLFQSCIEMIPINENKIEMGSIEIDAFDSRSSEYSSNVMIGGSAGFGAFKIAGSYSKEYQTTKKEQEQEKTITLRNQIDYIMVDVILLPSCPLHPQVKRDLIDIAKYQTNNNSLLATYLAQLFVKKYGTHYTSRLYLGGSIIEEDFVSHLNYHTGTSEEKKYKAAAEASFLSSFSLSASYSSSSVHSQATINEYKAKINRKIVNSKGGDIFIMGAHMQQWQASVNNRPVIIRRAVENLTYVIQAEKIPELTDKALSKVRKEIDEAINAYVEMNTVRGCMNRNSPSFNWVANLDDSACAPAEQTIQFGGFIRTCSEDARMSQQCSKLQARNYYTNNYQCKPDFIMHLLHTTIQYESLYTENCHKCGFLWLQQCCDRANIGQGRRELNLYGCSRNISRQLTSSGTIDIRSSYVFGGSFTTAKVNPVTNTYNCPLGLIQAYDIDGIKVCLSERITSSSDTLPRYGGMYSCEHANIATGSRSQTCPAGYSAYAMGSVNGNCLLEVCLKFEKLDQRRELPNVALPPFFSIDATYIRVETDEAAENVTISSRIFSDRYLNTLYSSAASQLHEIRFCLVVGYICITALYYVETSA
ncbi:unnamed protein product [Rotaria socialis]|nr:unnamed protein product [Rotaria socialis]